MNAKQAKLIPLQDYLFTLGIKPVKVLNNSLWYYSPLRSESTPSFKVNTSINCWHDFGSGERGNIIDLAMKINHIVTVSEALIAIEQACPLHNSKSFSFRQQRPSHKGLSDIRVQELQHPALIQLLKNRRISFLIAQLYCKEVHYRVNGKNYFSIGFPNNAGGYETLNPFFKGCPLPEKSTQLGRCY